MSTDQVDEYARQAHTLVDHVIENALRKLQNEHWSREKTKESISFDLSREDTVVYEEPKLEDFEVKNIKWLAISEFNAEKAEEKINEFIKV